MTYTAPNGARRTLHITNHARERYAERMAEYFGLTNPPALEEAFAQAHRIRAKNWHGRIWHWQHHDGERWQAGPLIFVVRDNSLVTVYVEDEVVEAA